MPCDECGEEAELVTVQDGHVCEACRDDLYERCADCRRYVRDDSVIGLDNGCHICDSCYEEDYFTCDRCDTVCHNDHYEGDGLCVDCKPGNIKPYSDRTASNLPPLGVGMMYGIELEVACKRDIDLVAEEVLDHFNGFVVLKEDSSIGEDGFEIVTRRASYDVQHAEWSEFLPGPKGMVSWDARTCGMHVHVQRSALSQLTIGKLLVFVNDPQNKAFITALAGRESSEFAAIKPKKFHERSDSRYEAINTLNPRTIEFRIFRGTTKKASFLKNLEFVDALIRYCRLAGCRDLTVPKFAASVGRKSYPNLYAWLKEHHYVPDRVRRA